VERSIFGQAVTVWAPLAMFLLKQSPALSTSVRENNSLSRHPLHHKRNGAFIPPPQRGGMKAPIVNSDYCYETEMKQILQRHKSGEIRVIPVILRPCDWRYTLFGELQALPIDGKPITSKDWQDHDEALYEVTMSLRKVIEEIHNFAS
jgi:hypothetical protein